MAGLSAEARDLDVVHLGLKRWFAHLDGATPTLSPFSENSSSGFTNQTLIFDVTRAERTERMVLRIPPAGFGLFPSYDLAKQVAVQSQLASDGVPTAAPMLHEPDPEWIGSEFVVMRHVDGHSPSDLSYAFKGWMHDAGATTQRTCMESLADVLTRIATIDPAPYKSVLARPAGSGLTAEVAWWREFLDWTGDGSPDARIADAYAWVADTMPVHTAPDSVVWNDARLSNTIFDDTGAVAAVVDFEQATIGPAEIDIAFWFATRRQTRENMRIEADPELPGFPGREELIARIEEAIGRELVALEWHETFAMIRMATCTLGAQRVLRRSGQEDHFIMRAPLLPKWAIAAIGADA